MRDYIGDGGIDWPRRCVFPPAPMPRTTPAIYPVFSVMSIYSDFMAVKRYIPPRQRPHLIDDAAESTSVATQQASSEEGDDGYKKPLDPTVQKTLELILETVFSDNTP